jgi:hypothetical protein
MNLPVLTITLSVCLGASALHSASGSEALKKLPCSEHPSGVTEYEYCRVCPVQDLCLARGCEQYKAELIRFYGLYTDAIMRLSWFSFESAKQLCQDNQDVAVCDVMVNVPLNAQP